MADNDISLFKALQDVIAGASAHADEIRDRLEPDEDELKEAQEIEDAINVLARRLGELSRQALDTVRLG